MNGIIKKITDKGFGFITSNGYNRDLFFHSNSLIGLQFYELREGDYINFQIEKTSLGTNAINVSRDWAFESGETELIESANLSDWAVKPKENKLNTIPNFSRYCIRVRDGKCEVLTEIPDGTTIFPDGTKWTNGLYVFPESSKQQKLLNQLENLINSSTTQEIELQHFLEEYPEFLLGDDFDYPIPQATIVTNEFIWKADFVLVPKNQLTFAKILEVKLPREKISLKSKSGHSSYSSNLFKAINQLKDYYEAFNSNSATLLFKEKYNTDIFKPDLQLLFGRRSSIANTKQFLEFQRRVNIKIKDWDTYLSELKERYK